MRKSVRSRGGIGAAALAGLCLTALSASAQDKPITTSRDNGDTVKVTVSGDVVLDYVWRGREVSEFVNPGGFGAGAATHNINDFEGYAAIRLNADLSDKVSAVVEMGTKRVDGGGILNWGNAAANGILLREGQVNLSDFLINDLKAQIGITTWSFDVRGKGESMAFDLRHSQQITQNMTLGGTTGLTTREGNGALGARAGTKDELEPVGLVLTYSRDALKVDAVILPAIVEGGFTASDEALYAVDFMYTLDAVGKGSHLGAIIAAHQFVSPLAGPGGELMWTIGGGGDFWLMDRALEVYAEAYGQFGTVAKPAAGPSIKAGGTAFQLGADYHLPNNANNLWAGINYTYYSGDNDQNAGNTTMDRFCAYSNMHDLMILEDMYTGFDWKSNYWALKIDGGLALSLGSGKNNLELSAIFGFARTQSTDTFTPAGALATTVNTHKLGDEIDLKARWLLNKQASINVGVGFLFSSDILKYSMLTNGDNRDKTGSEMYTIGLDVRF
ncbi:MAG TPA: hypothetical protein VEN81_09945 [Planctomycetota bacterium]|nr:hypothetical protein [Planctomycetota bacterium]